MNVDSLEARMDKDVVSVVLFGSFATGVADARSDTDVLVICRQVPQDVGERDRAKWADALGVPASGLTVYSKDIVQQMARDGSLLLHHVKREGRVLLDRQGWFGSLDVAPFADYQGELQILEELRSGVERSWAQARPVTALDLHVLQVVIRNACILLTAYCGSATFGRFTAVEKAKSLAPDLPVRDERYRELVDWHLAYTRGHATGDIPDSRRRQEHLEMATAVLEYVRESFAN